MFLAMFQLQQKSEELWQRSYSLQRLKYLLSGPLRKSCLSLGLEFAYINIRWPRGGGLAFF